jgi:uncharacterized membrane protein
MAILTAVLWSLSSVCGARAARCLGGPAANRLRLSLALIVLGAYVLCFPTPLGGRWFWLMVLSGAVGMGLGDLFLFAAYERLGTRLPVLITHSLAGPLAAVCEWLTRGVTLSATEILLCAIILLGVAIALVPGIRLNATGTRLRSGVLLGIASAVMVGSSAVLIRESNALTALEGIRCDGLTQAFIRGLGGTAISWAILPLLTLGGQQAERSSLPAQPAILAAPVSPWRDGWPWLVATALCGPFLGMACYQAALTTGKAGTVHAVLAILPILVMPMTWVLEGDRPTRWAVLGGGLAVAAAVLMALLHHG